MKIIFSIIILFVVIQNILGQHSTIYGRTINDKTCESVSFVKMELFDSLDNILKTVYSSDDGNYRIDSLRNGMYSVMATHDSFPRVLWREILINSFDTVLINFDLEVPEPCTNIESMGICPYCNSKKKVVRTSFATNVLWNFPNERLAIKYDKKIRKRGYEAYKVYKNEESEEEVVISVFIEGERDKFKDPCSNWFCKKCRKVFR